MARDHPVEPGWPPSATARLCRILLRCSSKHRAVPAWADQYRR